MTRLGLEVNTAKTRIARLPEEQFMVPAIPFYDGTRPYQTIPFQWST
jgi:hypothetical protein